MINAGLKFRLRNAIDVHILHCLCKVVCTVVTMIIIINISIIRQREPLNRLWETRRPFFGSEDFILLFRNVDLHVKLVEEGVGFGSSPE